MKNKCVYVYLDHRKPGNYTYGEFFFKYEPIYVGMGNHNRPEGHKYCSKKHKTRFYNKYNKIINDTGQKPEYIIIKDKITENDAKSLEIKIISLIGKIEDGGTLTNLTDGGDCHSGFTIDEKSIKKRSQTIKNSKEYLNNRKNRFIEKSKIIHKDKNYDYSLVEYRNAKTNVKIICSIHGVFEITPTSLISGRGCQYCGGNKKYTLEDFIKISNKKHNKKYNYSSVVFITQTKKVKIVCPIHGEFEQTPRQHMKGRGCRICGAVKSGMNRAKN